MMYLVNLTLQAPEEEYVGLLNTLKALGPWSNRLRGCWLVECRLTARQIRDLLKPHLRSGDRLFIAQIAQNWAATGMGSGFPDWMGRRVFEKTSTGA